MDRTTTACGVRSESGQVNSLSYLFRSFELSVGLWTKVVGLTRGDERDKIYKCDDFKLCTGSIIDQYVYS
jgi:hypothetical protein